MCQDHSGYCEDVSLSTYVRMTVLKVLTNQSYNELVHDLKRVYLHFSGNYLLQTFKSIVKTILKKHHILLFFLFGFLFSYLLLIDFSILCSFVLFVVSSPDSVFRFLFFYFFRRFSPQILFSNFCVRFCLLVSFLFALAF